MARTAIALVFAGAGLATLLATSRQPAPRGPVVAPEGRAPAAAVAAVVALTTPPPTPEDWPLEPAPRVLPSPGSASRLERRPDGPDTAGLDETTSVDTGDWRDTVVPALGREAVEHAPLDAGALHTHVAASVADARAPAPPPGLGAAGEQELQGWDGGEFWFGPNGLVRVREVAR